MKSPLDPDRHSATALSTVGSGNADAYLTTEPAETTGYPSMRSDLDDEDHQHR